LWIASGLVVTAAHLLRGAAFVTVTVEDAREVSAQVVGVDADRDLAILQLARGVSRAVGCSTRRVAEKRGAGHGLPARNRPAGRRRGLRATTVETTITTTEDGKGLVMTCHTVLSRRRLSQSRSMGRRSLCPATMRSLGW